MKKNTVIFAICFIVALAGGYFIFNDSQSSTTPGDNQGTEAVNEESPANGEKDNNSEEENAAGNTDNTESVDEATPLAKNNCLSCHAVDSLNVEGGNQGPDLSNAINEVENKRGKDMDAFLQDPSSTVMATVLEDNPLDEKEREEIIEYLEEAAEAVE